MSIFSVIKQCLIFLLLFCTSPLFADVVQPTLVDISVDQSGQLEIEIRTSIEALLTGINSQYKNTKDAPNAKKYDVLRKMSEKDLSLEFDTFQQQFLSAISLKDNHDNQIPLTLVKVIIPEPGYVKVPRASIIKLSANVDISASSLTWYYPEIFSDNIVKLKQVNKITQKYHWATPQLLRNDKPSKALSLTEIITKQKISTIIQDYVAWGFDHILPNGLDHILFILGLFLFSTAIKPLLWQVTMFTIAHTITLGLAMHGIISLPENIVEPLIALSIAYIGIENIFAKNLHNSRLVLVFIFGLLHGLGFARMLSKIGLPEDAFGTALISFNIGVELGQLSIILAAYLLIARWIKDKKWYKKGVVIPASLCITIVALYWFFDRLNLGS